MTRARSAVRERASACVAVLGLGVGLVALAGCKTVGPNFAPPAAPTESGYLMSGDAPSTVGVLTPQASPAGAWWKSFGSDDLDRTVDQALADNHTLAVANATLERTRQEAAAVRGAQDPQVDLNGSLQRERINLAGFGITGFPSPTLNLYSIGGTVSYDLDLFGGHKRATEEARAEAEAEARRTDAAYLTLTGQVVMGALHVATVREQIATVQRIIEDDRRLIDIVYRAQEAGGEAAAASTSPKAQLAQDQALLPPLEEELAQARHNLAVLVGRSPADWTAPEFDLKAFHVPESVPVSLPSALVRRRPDILAAEADLHAATAQIGVQSAALYPDVRLSANLTQTTIPPLNLFGYAASGWSFGAGVAQPLFHGGTLRANKRAAEADARASLARYQQTVLIAFVQIADVMEAITRDEQALVALAGAEDAASANLTNTETAYNLGGGALYPVIDAQRQLSQARRNRVAALGRRLSDIAQLYVATAADWRQAT